MTEEWHVQDINLVEYVEQRCSDSQAWSVEAHVIECDDCRRRLNEAASKDELAPLLNQVELDLDAALPAQGNVRTASRWRRLYVLLATAPAARGAWLLAVLFALASAIGLDLALPKHDQSWWAQHGSALMLIAPILPVLGVAVSYGRADPSFEATSSTAFGGLRLMLWRTLSVLLLTVPGALVVGFMMDRVSVTSWLLPAMGLTFLTLALGSAVRLEAGAVLVSASWVALTVGPLLLNDVPVLLAEPSPLLWSAVIGLSVGGMYFRRAAFHRGLAMPNRS